MASQEQWPTMLPAKLRPSHQHHQQLSQPAPNILQRLQTGAKDVAGNALAAGAIPNPWTFTTGTSTDTTAPTVTLLNPVDLSTTVCNNKTISATFSEAMDATTITTATFTLAPTATPAALVTGVVAYDPVTFIATFNPTADLTGNPKTKYTATIKGGAGGVTDVAGNALAVDKAWSFYHR